ncbi:hypothetical protein PWT90_07545 [Aphanocladium album]|nr:hypothetical protein PWT90_07545 [Aphanocladium album]
MKLNVLVLAATAMAAPAAKLVTHEARHVSHVAYTKGEAVDTNARVPVRIALKQRNMENAAELLMKVSDPKSADYGKHYTSEQMVSTFAPAAESVESVKGWLVANGIPADSIKLTANKGWLTFETTAGQLESLLNTKYSQYSHPSKGIYIGTDEYKLPSNIAEHIDFVQPAVALAPHKKAEHVRPKRRFWPLPKALTPDADSCAKSITPECLRKMYNFEEGSLSNPSNDLGIYEQASEQFLAADLKQFYTKYATNVPKETLPKVVTFNGNVSVEDSGEADLDFQMAVPIVYPQGTIEYLANGEGKEPDSSFFEPFLMGIDKEYCDGATIKGDCGTAPAPNVISVSYGDDEIDYSVKYLKRQCDEWMKLGMQGTSVLISSGDSGVASRNRHCLGKSKKVFVPGSLIGCPYVTAVGATQLPQGAKAGDAETATMEEFSSGGGFSNVHATPDYQKVALASYFSEHDPGYKSYNTSENKIPDDGGIYNRVGRGYPDVSANGLNGVVVVNGKEGTSGGTSQSAPIFAALITRIINERIKNGKKGPLGFLNPALYQNPDMFFDITSGDQHMGGPWWGGDDQPSACGNKGFSAVEGWDPVTGLGTPNYPKLLKVLGDL